MAVYDKNGTVLNAVYDVTGNALTAAYSYDGDVIYSAGTVIPTPSLESYSSGYIDDNGDLTSLSNNYVSDVYRSATGKVTVVVAEKELPNVNVIRIAEYDANKSFIQRQYIQRYNFYEFTLDEDTRFVRVGFQAINSPDLNDLFTYYQTTTSPILCNQIGYDTNKAKRATVIGKDGDTFYVANLANIVVYSGVIDDEVADFSAFTTTGTYFLYCDGIRSWPFTIGENRLWNVMGKPALDFMAQSRQDTFDVGGETGYAWRDSHQFSFELNGLVMEYMSNPSYYESLPYGIYKVNECEYTALRTQNCPDIIWLMKFAVMRYFDLNVNDGIDLHALIKAQVAYFLYLYPYITEYVDATWYETIRDWIITQWSVSTCDLSWFDVTGTDNDLFATQNRIGGLKGSLPPGYAIVPNLMMYEVCTRDGLNSASSFMSAAENNISWLVNSVDLTDPQYTKGQRMSEYITFHALTYAYEMYPLHCPEGTYAKILEVANLFITRADNEWDYVQYQTAGESQSINETIWVNTATSGGLENQPGNTAGFMAVAYSLARVISDASVKARLKELAVTQIDHVFGRNPLNRCFSYNATRDFNGAKQGWVSQMNGAGHLDGVIAVLDGSPKHGNYPYNPAGSTGYTEGWVAFNTAWNMALAYLNGENSSITDGIGLFATGT